MKKTTIFALTAVLVVVVAASGAFAWGGKGGQNGQRGRGVDAPMMMQGVSGQGTGAVVEIPQEIRDKQAEMQKLVIEMRAEMGKTPVDQAAVESLRKKGFELRNELSAWFMKQAGDRASLGMTRGMGGRGAMSVWATIEIPQEIRDKQAEMQKLSIDMRAEMGKNPVDRAKAEELYTKRVALRDELSSWRMKQKLDMIEKLQK